MLKSLHNSSRQTPEYYSLVIEKLIAYRLNKLTFPDMAEKLNAENITTPTGLQWTSGIMRQLNKKLKNYKTYPSFIHQHLLQLLYEGKVSAAEVALLSENRPKGRPIKVGAAV